MTDRISELLKRLGIRRPQSDAAANSDDELRLVLPLDDGRRVVVGWLSQDGESFVFRYSDEFIQAGLPALPDFPRLGGGPYRSRDLWPFFLVRIPPTDRPDVQREIQRLGKPMDLLQLLAHFGQRAVTSPYELELDHAVAR